MQKQVGVNLSYSIADRTLALSLSVLNFFADPSFPSANTAKARQSQNLFSFCRNISFLATQVIKQDKKVEFR